MDTPQGVFKSMSRQFRLLKPFLLATGIELGMLRYERHTIACVVSFFFVKEGP